MAFIFASSCFLLESHAFQWRAAAWLSPSASQGALCCHSQAYRTGRRGTGQVGGWEGGQEQQTRWTPPPPRGSWLFPSSSHLFHFCLVFFFRAMHCFSLLFLTSHWQSWARGQLGPGPELACPSRPIRGRHGGHLTQRLRMNGENKILKRQSSALSKRLSVFLSLFFCLKTDPQPRTHHT